MVQCVSIHGNFVLLSTNHNLMRILQMHVVEAMLFCVNASWIYQKLLRRSVSSFGTKAIKPNADVSNSQVLVNTFRVKL